MLGPWYAWWEVGNWNTNSAASLTWQLGVPFPSNTMMPVLLAFIYCYCLLVPAIVYMVSYNALRILELGVQMFYLLNIALQIWPAARINTSHGSTWIVVGTNKTWPNAIVSLLHAQKRPAWAMAPRRHGRNRWKALVVDVATKWTHMNP